MDTQTTSRALLLLTAWLVTLVGASANPTGASVRHGSVTIRGGPQTQIQQFSEKAIINWQSFSVNPGEQVRFLQPHQFAVILNRVVGQDPSQILGSLSSNGTVFLVNPNGIFFGPDVQLDVGSLVASTLSISDADFLSGALDFKMPSQNPGSVINQGTLSIQSSGFAVLMGPTVSQQGRIVGGVQQITRDGVEKASLSLDRTGLVHFEVPAALPSGPVLLGPGQTSGLLSLSLGVNPANLAHGFVRGPNGTIQMVNTSGILAQVGTLNQVAGETVIIDVLVTARGIRNAELDGLTIPQNDIDMVEKDLETAQKDLFSSTEESDDPTLPYPPHWGNDEFLREKFRR